MKDNNYGPLDDFIWASSAKHPDGVMIHIDSTYNYLLNHVNVKCWRYQNGKKVIFGGGTLTPQEVESLTQSLIASGFSKKQAEDIDWSGPEPEKTWLIPNSPREVRIEGSFTKPESRLKAFGRGLYNFIKRKDV